MFEFPNVQRGGYGCSGVGRELGLGGLHEYTELKSINYSGFKKSPVAAPAAPAAPAASPAAPAAVPVVVVTEEKPTPSTGLFSNIVFQIAAVAVVVAVLKPKLHFKW